MSRHEEESLIPPRNRVVVDQRPARRAEHLSGTAIVLEMSRYGIPLLVSLGRLEYQEMDLNILDAASSGDFRQVTLSWQSLSLDE